MPVVDRLACLLGAKTHGAAFVLQCLAHTAAAHNVSQAYSSLGNTDGALDAPGGHVAGHAGDAARL